MSKTFSYIKYNDESIKASETCKELCEKLEAEIMHLGAGRYQSLAITHLEICFMMIGKAIRDRQMLSEPQAAHLPERDKKEKPKVKIADARFENGLHGLVLHGRPVDHPRDTLNGGEVVTSPVMAFEGHVVETKNTIYQVQNWL